jgi:DNA-binding NtrC family response regulator
MKGDPMHGLARRQEGKSQANSSSLRKKAILLVESDLDVRLMLSMLLAEDGCIVNGCGSLAEALRAVAEKNFDFVITAHGQPGIDGLLLLDALRERGSVIPSVVVSSQFEKEPYLLAMNLGALDYFITPLDYAALQRLIHSRT